MAEEKRKILVLVEGERRDVDLMERLLRIFEIDIKYKIVPYRTNIYTLFNEMFADNDPSAFDLLQVLKAREHNESRKAIFDDVYSDMLLIFDYEPHAPDFAPEKIRRMAEYFTESSDMGKLYLNYPMVEAFYHMRSIPDPSFDTYLSTLEELAAGGYKARVGRENRNHDYRKFAVNKEECSIVIRQNIDKARDLITNEMGDGIIPEQNRILNVQLDLLETKKIVSVLSTCAFFIPEYNPKLIGLSCSGDM